MIFSWTAPDSGGSVNFQLSNDPFMSREKLLTEQTVLAGSKLTIKLPHGTAAYFWRVRETPPPPPAPPAAKQGVASAAAAIAPLDDVAHPWSFTGACPRLTGRPRRVMGCLPLLPNIRKRPTRRHR